MSEEEPTTSLTIRGINSQAIEAIKEQLSAEGTKGRNSPRENYLRALIHIDALQSPWAYMLWRSALAIAARMRGEKELRDQAAILANVYRETHEFSAALLHYQQHNIPYVQLIYRLANVLYYLVQKYAQDGDLAFYRTQSSAYCVQSSLPPDIALECAAMKMYDRSLRSSKHVPAEIAAIERILASHENSFPHPLTNDII